VGERGECIELRLDVCDTVAAGSKKGWCLMAGEWIPIDCNLGMKPEVLEVAAATHEPIEVVVGRMVRLWSWAWHVTADGTIRVPRSTLATVAGGDETFWDAVERAGWLSSSDGCITIPGWEDRFGNAAKRRLLEQRRQSVRRAYAKRTHDSVTDCVLEERRGEEKREEYIQAAPVPTSKPPKASRSSAKSAISWDSLEGWQGITEADRQEWAAAYPGAVLDQELAKAASWLKANPTRAVRKNWRKFFTGWLSRCQDRGGTHREQGNRQAQPPASDPAKRRWWRAEAGRNMSDREFAIWKQEQTAGPAAALAAALTSRINTEEP
jgi:hypothetical protein